MKNYVIFFWRTFVNELWLMEKKEDKMEIFVVEFLDYTKG